MELKTQIASFIQAVGLYLAWHRATDRVAEHTAPTAAGSPAEAAAIQRVRDHHEHEMDARDAVLAAADGLPEALERVGVDPSGVLRVMHFLDGGGPDRIAVEWADLKVQLQRAAISTGTAAATSDGHVENPVDPTAYRPAAEIIRDHADVVPDHRSLMRVLADHVEIRRWKPSPRRLRIHVGDWLQFIKSSEGDWDDNPLRVEERKRQVRGRRLGN